MTTMSGGTAATLKPARMRTQKAALEQLKKEDPGTCLTAHALRQMIISGQIPSFKVASKYLISYDKLLEILAGEAHTPD